MGSLKEEIIKGRVEEQSQEKKIRRKVGLKKYYKHKPIFKTANEY